LLRARKAVLPPDGTIKGEAVRVEMYDEAGALEGVMTLEGVDLNPEKRVGKDDGAVRLDYKGVTIEGQGVTWNDKKHIVRIESNAVVTVNELRITN